MSLPAPRFSLFSRLQACGLVTAEQWNSSRAVRDGCSPDDEAHIIDELKSLGILTEWQLAQLQEGQTSFLLDNGRYVLQRELGRGGMGIVYLALHRKLQRPFAVKVLPKSRTHDPDLVARFVREMEAIGRLNHPHIVQATDAGEIEGQHYLVMEHVEGGTLADVLRAAGPLRVADACEIARQAALGLQHVADHHLVHRDVKPSNLMLQCDGVTKVSDLGLALLRAPAGPDTAGNPLTVEGQLMGTLDYMAPEQTGNPHGIDIRADIYSLGCTLFALLTGSPPFSRTRIAGPYELIRAHCEETPVPVTTLRTDAPAALSGLVSRTLAKSAADRPQRPRELADELAAFTDGHDLCRLAARAFAANGSQGSFAAPSTVAPISSALTGTIHPAASADFAGSSTPTRNAISAGAPRSGDAIPATRSLSDSRHHARRFLNDLRKHRSLWTTAGLMMTAVAVSILFRSRAPTDEKKPSERNSLAPSTAQAGIPILSSNPADPALIADSRVVAPDTSAHPALVFEDFRRSRGMLQKSTTDVRTQHEDDRYSISVSPTWSMNAPCPGDLLESPGCRIVGRAATGRGGWFVDLYRNSGGRTSAIRVSVESGPQVRVGPAWYQTDARRGPRSATIRHPAIRPIDKWNDLFVLLRNGRIEIYVNSIAVCAPIEVDPDHVPAQFAVGGTATSQSGETAEFLSFASWRSEELPDPTVRASPAPTGPEPSAPAPLNLPPVFPATLPTSPREATQLASIAAKSLTLELQTSDADAPVAPDLTKITPLHVDSFSTPGTFPARQFNDVISSQYRDGRWALRAQGATFWGWHNEWQVDDFVCEVTARTRGRDHTPTPLRSRWGLAVLSLNPATRNRGFEVGITGSSKWMMRPSVWDTQPQEGPWRTLSQHASILPGAAFNTLRVTVQGRRVWLHVNGDLLCSPFALEYDVLPAKLVLCHSCDGYAESEFDELAVWPANDSTVPRKASDATAAPELARASLDREREAARQFLDLGGRVELLCLGRRIEVSDNRSLPTSPFRVVGIHVKDRPAGDSELKRLDGLANLENLTLEHTSITGVGFADVRSLRSLDWLVLHESPISDEGLGNLAHLATVTHLSIGRSAITNRGLSRLAGLQNLCVLGLAGTEVDDDAIEHIARLPRLQEVYMEHSRVKGLTLDRLTALPGLQKLDLKGCPLSDDALSQLAMLVELQYLALDETPLSGPRLSEIERLERLEVLGLGRIALADSDLVWLSKLPELREFFAWRTPAGDGTLKHLQGLPQLRRVGLDQARVTDHGLESFDRVPALRRLEVRGSAAVTESGAKRFRDRHPACEVLR